MPAARLCLALLCSAAMWSLLGAEQAAIAQTTLSPSGAEAPPPEYVLARPRGDDPRVLAIRLPDSAPCPHPAGQPWLKTLLQAAQQLFSATDCAGQALGDLGHHAFAGPDPGHPRPLRLYDNERVERYRRFYLEKNRAAFERGFRRSGRYMTMIRRIFAEEGIPVELAYLAAVESNFNPRARSPARAVGLWQFMVATARRFDLRVRYPWYDERLDPERSTRAAARLLGYLHDRYGEWELALAAYNAGEGRINRAMRRARRAGHKEDYWNLRLPAQTLEYVPAFLAVTRVFQSPADFGFEGVTPDPPEHTEKVVVTHATSLAEVAHRLDLELQEVVRLNPAWRRGRIPPSVRHPVLLRLPAGMKERLRESLATEEVTELPWLTHTVRPNETLSHISIAYGVPIAAIISANPIGNKHLLAVGQRLIIPVTGGSRPTADVWPDGRLPASRPAAPARPIRTHPPNTVAHFHQVRQGQSLWSISRRYGVTSKQLRHWNPHLSEPIQPLQEMVVFLPKLPPQELVAMDGPSS